MAPRKSRGGGRSRILSRNARSETRARASATSVSLVARMRFRISATSALLLRELDQLRELGFCLAGLDHFARDRHAAPQVRGQSRHVNRSGGVQDDYVAARAAFVVE